LFYVVYLPIIWIAVRTGIEGASIGILITQVGLILGMQLVPGGTRDIIAFQVLMLILAITGLVVGALVTEGRCTEAQLRLHQESLAEATPHRTRWPISPRKQSRSSALQPLCSSCGRWCGLTEAIAWRARSITLSGKLLTYASPISIA
jgi:hypothetical protein